jgi:hypothetical protein
MTKFLQLASWNANDLSQHTEELKPYLHSQHRNHENMRDTHHTETSYLKLLMNYPAGTARGGTAIIIKNCIKLHQLSSYSQDFLQATTVLLNVSVSL